MIFVGARQPDDALLNELLALDEAREGVPEDSQRCVSGVGDCLAPGIIQAAVFSGHAEARRLLGDASTTGHFKRETPVLFV